MGQPRAISGNQGDVLVGGCTIAELGEWQATLDGGVQAYTPQSSVQAGGAASGTVGYQKTVQGNFKCNGTVSGWLDPNYPPGTVLQIGALVVLKLVNSNALNSYVACTARIATRSAGASIQSGVPQPFSFTFESDGLVTLVNM